uniref:Uncharacterized protein n=1 Tax=Ananas comosus var. bracteatus TaxID=296719 RepID=A0A6V7P227_ANACO|nr:unnamed protein product [Ananas comosus var. bracteatus]
MATAPATTPLKIPRSEAVASMPSSEAAEEGERKGERGRRHRRAPSRFLRLLLLLLLLRLSIDAAVMDLSSSKPLKSLRPITLLLLLLPRRRPRPSLSISFSLLLLLIAAIAADAASSPGSFRKSGSPSVFSLFNLKAKSKFWSESVIRKGDFDDLEGSVSSDSGRMAVFNYTKAGNVANYMKLSEVDSIYLPVPVNFIFIGFEGKGNHDFKLGPEELERWFSKIDHIFEHTRIPPVGELFCTCYTDARKVTSVFEYAIKALSRKEDLSISSENEELLWQVDIDRMEYVSQLSLTTTN